MSKDRYNLSNALITVRGNRKDGYMLFLTRDRVEDLYLGFFSDWRDADSAMVHMTTAIKAVRGDFD